MQRCLPQRNGRSFRTSQSINDQEVPISLIKSRCPTFWGWCLRVEGGGGIGGVKNWKHFFFALVGCTKLQVDNLTSWLYKAYVHNLTFLSCFGLHEDWIRAFFQVAKAISYVRSEWHHSWLPTIAGFGFFLPILSPASTVLSTLAFKMWIYSSSHWNFH